MVCCCMGGCTGWGIGGFIGCGMGGGYILSAGAVADNPKLENLRAMVAAVKEYGVYRK